MNKLKLIGPFHQIVTMNGLSLKGPIGDKQLEFIENAGILVNNGIIESIGNYRELYSLTQSSEQVNGIYTVIPGMIDAHTHICWAGSRARDYAMRLEGKNYLDIGRKGGGIWSTVQNTRSASMDDLARITAGRANQLLAQGITTIEVKSGYGLNAETELKMLEAISKAKLFTKASLVATCLAAHIKPKDFNGNARQYLRYIIDELLPVIRQRQLAERVDIYVDDGAFSMDESRHYLKAAKLLGFQLVVHADQFFPGGLQVAVELEAISADHLETTTDEDIHLLAKSRVIPIALPGASIGLGAGFAPARNMLNSGASLAIASDWNPGSAPMGKLLTQASILGMYEKLSMAETFAALTFRAAHALGLNDRGILKPGMIADFVAFPCSDYREILYSQGALEPGMIWKNGCRI